VQEVIAIRERLATAEDLPSLIAAGREAFGLIRAICQTSEGRSDELSASLASASASALQGRNVLSAAPSMPCVNEVTTLRPPPDTASLEHDLEEVTGELADLASALAKALRRAGPQGRRRDDRRACDHGAVKAERIRDLLYPPYPA
jgi:hypothetical protein